MKAGLGFGILSRDVNGQIWLTVTAEPEDTGLVIESLTQNRETVEGQYQVVRQDEMSILDLIALHQGKKEEG